LPSIRFGAAIRSVTLRTQAGRAATDLFKKVHELRLSVGLMEMVVT
jgi:hypothetical protein